MNPPQVSCSASPSTVKSGDPVTITASASSPDNAQITGYAYQGTDENACSDLQNTTPVDESAVQPSENAYPRPRTAVPSRHHAAASPQQ